MITEIHPIPLRDIEISPQNVRLTDKETNIAELADSIKRHSLLQPVVLKGKYLSPPYYLVIGQRRFRAYQMLAKENSDYENIKAVFIDDNTNRYDVLILSLAENVQRAELNYADKAKALNELYKHFGKSIHKVSKAIGLHENTIREYIKIEELATVKMKRMLADKKVSKADVKRALVATDGNSARAESLLGEFQKYNFTKFEKERAVEFGKRNKNAHIKDIIKEGTKAKFGESIILNLSTAVKEALEKAESALSLERVEIATLAIEDWLKKNGFMN